MFCRYCGKTIAEDSIFCAYCGKSLAAPKTTPTSVGTHRPKCEKKRMEALRFIYAAHRSYASPSEEEIHPLVAISDFLIANGFTFCRASTADGISEILHTGDAPYNVAYRDLDDFRNHFVEDFHTCQKTKCEESGGWISSLNYGHVDVYLKKDELLFHAAVGGENIVEWFGHTEQDREMIERANDAMQRILVTCSCVEQRTNVPTNQQPCYWS